MNQEGPALREFLPRQKMERYLFYLAVTRAKERLILTYPHIDREGKPSLASFYLDEIHALFGDSLEIRKQNLDRPYPEISEAASLREFRAALTAQSDAILLDNWRLPAIRQAVLERRRWSLVTGHRSLLEVSGGVTLANVRAIAATGVDRISIGRLTHSAPALDCSLKVIHRKVTGT